MFPLCRTYAETLQQTPCKHTEEERMLSGIWCSIETDKALELGYRVVRMIDVWHFPQKSSTLFRDFIATFLKIKQQARGWPSWCETEGHKQQYITEHEKKRGIKLEYGNLNKNPGLRLLAKLTMNSFCKYHLRLLENDFSWFQ